MNYGFQTISDIIFFLNFLSFQSPFNTFSHGDKTLPEKDNFRRNCDV